MASFFLYVYSGDFFLCVYIGIFPGGGGAQVVGSVTFFPLCLQSECFFQVCVCVWPVCVWGGAITFPLYLQLAFFSGGGGTGTGYFFPLYLQLGFLPRRGITGCTFFQRQTRPPPWCGAESTPMSYVLCPSRVPCGARKNLDIGFGHRTWT